MNGKSQKLLPDCLSRLKSIKCKHAYKKQGKYAKNTRDPTGYSDQYVHIQFVRRTINLSLIGNKDRYIFPEVYRTMDYVNFGALI
jgi:hypothetical protein